MRITGRGAGILIAVTALVGSLMSPAVATTGRVGRLDTTFGGGDGTVNVPKYSAVTLARGETLEGLFVRPGGAFRTVTVGYGAPLGPPRTGDLPGYVTVRGYRANGSVDPTFNGGAPRVLRNIIAATGGPRTGVVRTAMDSSGRIVIATARYDVDCFGPCEVRLYRVLANGGVDSTYHPIWTESQLPDKDVQENQVAITPDGRARLCLTSSGSTPNTTFVFGYTTSGAVESSFGTGETPGVARLPGGKTVCEAIGTDSANRLLIANWSDTDVSLHVSRLTASGHLDTTFGARGVAHAVNWGRSLSPSGITGSRNGAIYVSGMASAYAGPTAGTLDARSLFVAKLYPSGAAATPFGRRGVGLVAVPASRYVNSWFASTRAQQWLSVDSVQRIYVPLAAAPEDASHGIAPGWVRLNGYTAARDTAWGVSGFVALPKSSRAEQHAGPVLTVAWNKVLTGATLVRSGTATGGVIQRRWSS